MNLRNALILAASLCAIPTLGQGTTPAQPEPQPKVIHAAPPSQLQDVVAPLPAKPDPAKDAAIRHLLDLTSESKMAEGFSGTISMQIRQVVSQKMSADRLQKFMVDFDSKFRASAPPSQVIDAVIPIYSNTFSMDEIQGLIKFYESPLGQKIVQTMPQVAHDEQQAGFNLEKKAAIETLQAMTTDYPEIGPLLPGGQKPAEGQAPATAPGQTTAPKPSLAPTPAPTTPKPDTPQQ
jgi:hypothetical protein